LPPAGDTRLVDERIEAHGAIDDPTLTKLRAACAAQRRCTIQVVIDKAAYRRQIESVYSNITDDPIAIPGWPDCDASQ
jgi:hypothetical protein